MECLMSGEVSDVATIGRVSDIAAVVWSV
jgi:hypothetical protein